MQSTRVGVLTSVAQTQAALDTNVGGGVVVDTAVIVDAAPLPTNPLPRNTLQLIFMAVAAALVLGVGLAFLLEYVDYTIKTPELLDRIYGIPAQGVIGGQSVHSIRESNPPLITVTDPRSPSAEAFRALRISVQVAGLSESLHSLLVTSAVPNEGKTFVSSNLAVSLAQNGLRVILVDLDLRKPSIHQVFESPREPGFTNLMFDQQGDISAFLHPSGVENLRILPCGTIPPRPAELLGSQRAAQLMKQLVQHADIVVYDSPPAATVTDAVVVAPRVDAVLHVIGAGQTRIDLVLRCKAFLERGGAHIMGPVLNRVRIPEVGQYSYYYEEQVKEQPRLLRWLSSRLRLRDKKAAPAAGQPGVSGFDEATILPEKLPEVVVPDLELQYQPLVVEQVSSVIANEYAPQFRSRRRTRTSPPKDTLPT
jgi:capsular exopolysaccharide synthesis family protein